MNKNIFSLLRKDLEVKIGRKVKNTKDCTYLKEQIQDETNRQISNSTLKRFFGLITTNFLPSRYTLETFIEFLGFKNWDEYRNCYDASRYSKSGESNWSLLKSRTQIITEHSLLSLKQKTGYRPEEVVSRTFTKKLFEEFTDSSQSATLLIAPDGYGKSTTLIQLAENYFLNENGKCKNDILLLIDGGIFFNLYSKNPNLELLSQLLDFKVNAGQNLYFQNFPEQREGRIFIFIDSIDEVFFGKEQYHKFLENLSRMIMSYDRELVKMVFTCKPENVDVFAYLVNKNPLLKSFWFNINFDKVDDINEIINVPLLTWKEIKEVLQKLNFDRLIYNKKNIPGIIKHPYFFSLFIKEYNGDKDISEINLVKNFLKIRLYSPPYAEEKIKILKRFIELCNLGRETNVVKKKVLLSKAKHKLAYQELISYGIIYEHVVSEGLFKGNTYVKFCNNLIFEYILLEKWKEKNKLDFKLFVDIKEFYTNNVHLQCNILKLLIKLFAYEKEYKTVKTISDYLKKDVVADSESSFCLNPLLSLAENVIEPETTVS